MAKRIVARAVQSFTPGGNRAILYRRLLEQPRKGCLLLRGLRTAVVQLGYQIRFWHRLAQLLRSGFVSKYYQRNRRELQYGPNGSEVPAVWLASWTRV